MDKLQDDILKIRVDAEGKASKAMNPILIAYKKSLNEVRREISDLYMQYSVDGVLKISRQDRYTFLKNLEKQLIVQAKLLGNVDVEQTTKILSDIYQDSYYQTAYTINKGVEVAADFALLKPEMVSAAVHKTFKGEEFSDRIWKNKKQLVKTLKQEIENGIIQGHSIDKMGKVIANRFGVTAFQSKRIVNTELARVVSQAQQKIYEESDVVQKVMWSATLDSKTSPEDGHLDGKVWGVDESHPIPPLHPNCRCALIPVIAGWSSQKRRENIGDKNVVDYSTYDDWKKSKGI